MSEGGGDRLTADSQSVTEEETEEACKKYIHNSRDTLFHSETL